MDRPSEFEFAMDFLGEPEASSLRAYIEGLELDAGRYRCLRDNPRADVRIVGVGKREGAALDAAVDECIVAWPTES